MRILMINPNMTQNMTDSMAEVAIDTAGDIAQIIPSTATRGFPYISSRAEAQIAGAHVLETIAAHQGQVDAVIVAAFGDPGLVAARELFEVPVVGMAEAAVLTAAMLGERFSVVTFSPHMVRWYQDCVLQTGLGARFTGVRCPADPPNTIDNIATELKSELIALAHKATSEDGADVIIMGGAPLAGLAPKIAEETTGILIDPIAAATAQAIAMLVLSPNLTNRAASPAAKASTGLSPALAAIIAGEKE
ncbi:MAG: aspartate/glutamate racemase family protein [Pseudomonadota bacterium]